MSTKWINVNGGSWNEPLNWDNGIPSPTNQAVFDPASFSANGKVITASALMQCQGFDASTVAYSFTIQSAVYGLELYGDFVGSANCTITLTGTAYAYLKSNLNITQGGSTLNLNRLYVNGTGITASQAAALSIGATSLYLTNGTFTTANFNFTSTGSMVTEAGTKTLTLGSSTFNIGIWNNAVSTGFTFNYNTSTVNITGTGTFTGAQTFYNLTTTGAASITAAVSFAANITVNNNLIITGANATSQRVLIQSNTIGTPRTITCNGTTNITNCDFQDITLAGTANRDFSAQTDIGDCGGNSGITFPPAIDCYIKHTSGAMSVSNIAKWVTTDGGSTQARVPLPQDRAWGVASSFTGASTVTMDCPRIGSIDLSGVTQAVGWTLGNAISCYGNYVLGSNITQSGNYILTLSGRANYNINTFSKPCYFITIYTYGGIYKALSDILCTASNLGFYIPMGTFDLNGYNLDSDELYVSGTMYFRSGIITLIKRATSDIVLSLTGTIYEGTSTIKLNPSSTSANFSLSINGKSLYNIWFSGSHTGTFDITGSNTFNNIKIDAGRKVRFTAGTTQTLLTPLDAVGTSAAPITISSITAAEHTLNYTGSRWIQCDWLNITNSKILPVNRWFAGKNSVDGGGNTNWNFKRYIMTPIITLIRRI